MKDETVTKVGCAILALLPFGCCLWFSWPETVTETVVVAKKRDAGGTVVRRLTAECCTRHAGPPILPGAHGGFYRPSSETYRYYIDGDTNPAHELPFLSNTRLSPSYFSWSPVQSTDLWLRTYSPYVSQHGEKELWQLQVLVFDDIRIVHRRDLPCFGEQPIRMGQHNRGIDFPTKTGFQTYDVITDTVRPAKTTDKQAGDTEAHK